jgi:hypothetical protein
MPRSQHEDPIFFNPQENYSFRDIFSIIYSNFIHREERFGIELDISHSLSRRYIFKGLVFIQTYPQDQTMEPFDDNKEVPEGPSGESPRQRQSSFEPHQRRSRQVSAQRLRQTFADPQDQDMMGPLLRRKKVVSMPLGSSQHDFFSGPPARHLETIESGRVAFTTPKSGKETSWPPPGGAKVTRKRNTMSLGNLIKRKQVSLDLYAPEQAEFFGVMEEEVEDIETVPMIPEEGTEPALVSAADEEGAQPEVTEERPRPFLPLQFSPQVRMPGVRDHDHEPHKVTAPAPAASAGPVVDDELRDAVERQARHNRELKIQIAMLSDRLEGETDAEQEKLLEDIHATQGFVESNALVLETKLFGDDKILEDEGLFGDVHLVENEEQEDMDDEGIIRATRLDYIWTGILLCVMIAFTGVVVGWDTHLNESYSTFGAVGLACATPCTGDVISQDYFHGHSKFETGQFIQLTMQLDPSPYEASALVQIVGHETGQVKAEVTLGPPFPNAPNTFVEKIEVDFDHPDEEHIINVTSTDSDVTLTYKLNASKLSHLAKHSELIAALIMIFVYIFILLEVIHRTLVAIFGSMVALLFFFLIHEVRLSLFVTQHCIKRCN